MARSLTIFCSRTQLNWHERSAAISESKCFASLSDAYRRQLARPQHRVRQFSSERWSLNESSALITMIDSYRFLFKLYNLVKAFWCLDLWDRRRRWLLAAHTLLIASIESSHKRYEFRETLNGQRYRKMRCQLLVLISLIKIVTFDTPEISHPFSGIMKTVPLTNSQRAIVHVSFTIIKEESGFLTLYSIMNPSLLRANLSRYRIAKRKKRKEHCGRAIFHITGAVANVVAVGRR